MKKFANRALSFALTLSLLAAPVLALRETDIFTKRTLPIAGNVNFVTSGVELESTTDGTRPKATQEHIVTYKPGDRTVLPVVAYGETLYGRSTMAETAKYLTDEGLSVVAAINGSFFDMSTGIPYGIVITDGILRSSGAGYAVGFYEDGRAVISETGLAVTAVGADGEEMILNYNKALSATTGYVLYSADYDLKTKNTVSAYNVVLQPVRGEAELAPSGSLDVRVTGIVASTPSCPIPDGSFVLSIADATTYQTALEKLKTLKIGDELTIRTQIDRDWENVRYACGGGDLLVKDGRALDSFTLDSADDRRARTAVGLRQDGTLVLYTADHIAGTERSDGLRLAELAERMKVEGCQIALNLDGGGSTAVGAQYPGYASCVTANAPSDGKLRPCANFIYLVRQKTLSRQATQLYLYPYDQYVLPGAKLAMTAKAADASYMAATLPGALSYTATNASITADGVVTVDKDASTEVKVTATSGGLRAEASLSVLPQVTEIAVMKEETTSALTTLTVAAGSKTDLKARARYYGRAVAAQDVCFTWSCDEAIGSIDAGGVFTAANASGKTAGKITVSYGQTKTELSVTVAAADPFTDMKNHWAKSYVSEMYFDGVLAGATGSDGKLYYRPDDSMTRQEFVVALMRFMKVDPTGYHSVELPFADTDHIASWAQDAMKAAYALGYVGGSSSNGKLYGNPTSTISRQEAMVILARSQNLTEATDSTALSRFSDAGLVANWAAESLAAMIERNIIGGSNGKLNPTGNVTRAQVAKMLYSLKYQA